ncbi:DinB family protein [Granulicella tundricola]|uniref:DinB-like domain-containing protein n=1 Tax=Granulicella tundricola (strain ATCC BAA-1859 / DSM 23138 / MP5ACTX9) TaxID=1198114 RepID=E8X5G5_GRATM|nr:DUF664 domain-containing protein [Granulicella tundricola]ADW69512.1 hypothetical protein AciX9_2479 [Granulicella tundricola MP5ACTX9]
MGFSDELAGLYARDLARLRAQVELFPNDEAVWVVLPGVVNPAGTLVLHLEGNLREYVGRVLGGIAYVRDRPVEFSARGVSQRELAGRIAEVEGMIPGVVAGLSSEVMEGAYPGEGNGEVTSTQRFLTHMYGHLGWHLGQIDYLRRMLAGGESKA